ncbi:MAG: carcinine hydrolase/isopenicillin-N N-acyltransferase family protein, partial [Promethearchaeota archaeon]
GLPWAFMMRSLLESTSVDSAVELLKRTKNSTAGNYIFGDKDKVVDYECSANKNVEYRPFPNRVFHTNHALVNDDFHLPLLNPPYIRANTYDRLEYVQYRMDPSKPFTPHDAKNLLSSSFGPIDKPRMGVNMGIMTIYSSLFLLSEEPELHLAPGNPSQFAYEVHSFDF